MVKVNMMSGARNFGDDWVHIDRFPSTEALHSGNNIFLTGQFFDSIDLIYCSHGIAYFTINEARELLISWLNRLKPGGKIEIATPDLFKISWMLTNSKCLLPQVIGPLYGEMGPEHSRIFHKTGYDEACLTSLLTSVGFVDIKRYDHRETCHPNTGSREDKYDDHSAAYINGELISLNIQAIKPI